MPIIIPAVLAVILYRSRTPFLHKKYSSEPNIIAAKIVPVGLGGVNISAIKPSDGFATRKYKFSTA